MSIIGLTGGIAAGKSTAADILREFGATVIDADRLGHRSYEPGTPGFQKVVNAFGHDIVSKDGTIDRRILGGKVFGAPGQLERLNAIVWPEIRTLIKEEVKQIRAQEDDAIIILEAAVLLEAGWQDLCDEIWVILTPVRTAVDRLKERNGLSEDAAMARINAQMSNKERAEQAGVKIENASTEEQLRARVERAWRSLLNRTGQKARYRGRTTTATKTGSRKASSSKKSASSKPASSKTTKTTRPTAAKPAAKRPSNATTRAAAAQPAAKSVTQKTASKATAKPAASAKPATKTTTTTTRAASKSASGTAKASSTKAASTKAASTRAGAAKPASTRAATAKAPTAKSRSTKASSSKAAGSAKSAPKQARAPRSK